MSSTVVAQELFWKVAASNCDGCTSTTQPSTKHAQFSPQVLNCDKTYLPRATIATGSSAVMLAEQQKKTNLNAPVCKRDVAEFASLPLHQRLLALTTRGSALLGSILVAEGTATGCQNDVGVAQTLKKAGNRKALIPPEMKAVVCGMSCHSWW
jgi:hypothetical protein